MARHLAVLAGRRHVDGPVAGSADVARSASFHRFECAVLDLVSGLHGAIQVIAAPDTHRVGRARYVENVIQSFGSEVALDFGDPGPACCG